MSLVSVIVCTFNGEKYLNKSIESIIEQRIKMINRKHPIPGKANNM